MIAHGKGSWRSGGPMLGRTYAFPHHRPRRARRLAALGAAVLVVAWWRSRRNHEPAAP